MGLQVGFRRSVFAWAAVAAAASLACSFSYSSKSSSDSSASASRSSSSSSPGGGARNYRDDVASYTEAFVVSGGGQGSFLDGVGALAEKRGITDWEADPNTWRGIGQGLGRTKIDGVQLGVYKQNWAGDDPSRMAGIQKGFDEVR